MRLSIRLRLRWWVEPFGLLAHHFEASFLEHQSPSLLSQLKDTSESASAWEFVVGIMAIHAFPTNSAIDVSSNADDDK